MSETGQLSIEKLQQELSLKQLQINSLLTITQAINDNVAAPELYSMYKSFIGWDMGIKRMALFFRNDDEWQCVTQLQADFGLPETSATTRPMLSSGRGMKS